MRYTFLLALDLAGDDPPAEAYLAKVGRLNMARLQAEEIVLREQILPLPEPGARQDVESAPFSLCSTYALLKYNKRGLW